MEVNQRLSQNILCVLIYVVETFFKEDRDQIDTFVWPSSSEYCHHHTPCILCVFLSTRFSGGVENPSCCLMLGGGVERGPWSKQSETEKWRGRNHRQYEIRCVNVM